MGVCSGDGAVVGWGRTLRWCWGARIRLVKCAEMRFDCGFTVDGELVRPEPGRVVSLTADDTVHFVRA